MTSLVKNSFRSQKELEFRKRFASKLTYGTFNKMPVYKDGYSFFIIGKT